MTIHDWTRVDAGLFHAFHQRWISALCDTFNTGRLPPEYFALPEQSSRGPVPDVLTLRLSAATEELRAFVEETADLLRQNFHLLVIDLFPPSQRDLQGIHKAPWDEFLEEDFALPADKPLTLAAYDAGPPRVAYVEPVAVGDRLPDMPLFLKSAPSAGGSR